MKNIICKLGLATIICLSFFLSEKTTSVVKDTDGIMVELKNIEGTYYVKPENAKVVGDTIVPGINGKKVNVSKSYDEMKKIGFFNDKYLIFDDIDPGVRLKDNYDKVIVGGNSKKNTVSLIFMVYGEDDIMPIVEVLDVKKVNATFFVDGKWLEQNNNVVLDLIKRGHTIGNLSYDMNYQSSEFIWMNSIFRTIGKQKVNYCYDTKVLEDLKVCAKYKNFTVRPDIIVKDNPLIEIKKQIKPGSLISMGINDDTVKQLGLVIDYIKSKGFLMENLSNHLSEKNSN